MVCTFFGHRECSGLDRTTLRREVEEQIAQGVDRFYVGHQGQFDNMVRDVLTELKEKYPHISFAVVLAYLPSQRKGYDDCGSSIYPEGLEAVPPRFAIEKRNKWMIARSDRCLCFINYPFGGAFRFARLAKKKGLAVINLGNLNMEG